MIDDTSDRPMSSTDDDLGEDEALEGDRPSGWAGVTDALGDTENRPAGPDYGDSPLDDETPGSQGEIESGSEGDFGNRDEAL